MDLHIPSYGPLDVPYSEWETQRSKELLAANGFGDTVEEWLRASRHENGLLRETAYYLLTRQPEPEREALYRRGLEDADESVQALAAYGLYRLGDESVLGSLEELARLDVGAHTAAARAASILGEVGDPSAFATIHRAMESDEPYVRLFAIKNAFPFVALHGKTFASGHQIDIWSLYERALTDEVMQVRETARLQLRGLDTPEAAALIAL